jgi:shikimate dehydrogenase
MGKDSPGSPVTGQGLFPDHGVAWEFNYRGELVFLHQALAQVLHFELTPALFTRLMAAAESFRKLVG